MTNIQYADVTVIASQLNADGVESILLDADFVLFEPKEARNMAKSLTAWSQVH